MKMLYLFLVLNLVMSTASASSASSRSEGVFSNMLLNRDFIPDPGNAIVVEAEIIDIIIESESKPSPARPIVLGEDRYRKGKTIYRVVDTLFGEPIEGQITLPLQTGIQGKVGEHIIAILRRQEDGSYAYGGGFNELILAYELTPYPSYFGTYEEIRFSVIEYWKLFSQRRDMLESAMTNSAPPDLAKLAAMGLVEAYPTRVSGYLTGDVGCLLDLPFGAQLVFEAYAAGYNAKSAFKYKELEQWRNSDIRKELWRSWIDERFTSYELILLTEGILSRPDLSPLTTSEQLQLYQNAIDNSIQNLESTEKRFDGWPLSKLRGSLIRWIVWLGEEENGHVRTDTLGTFVEARIYWRELRKRQYGPTVLTPALFIGDTWVHELSQSEFNHLLSILPDEEDKKMAEQVRAGEYSNPHNWKFRGDVSERVIEREPASPPIDPFMPMNLSSPRDSTHNQSDGIKDPFSM